MPIENENSSVKTIPSPDATEAQPVPPKLGRLQRLKLKLGLMASIEAAILNPPELPPEHHSVENHHPDAK